MSFLESLPFEILYKIISYINKIEDLKSMCLTSKTFSAVSSPSLYRNLVILDDYDDYKEMSQVVREITKGRNLQYVRTLHIGACNIETTEEIDKLLAALPDNSLHRFSYLFSENESAFPKESQTKYICLHQNRICNLHFGYFFETILYLPPDIQSNFLSSITELSIPLSHSVGSLKFSLPLWVMRILNSFNLRKLEVFSNMTLSNNRLASFFSIWPTPNLTHLSFIEYLFEDDEMDLATMPHLTHLVFKNCYNMIRGLHIIPETRLKSLELNNTNTNLRQKFHNLRYNYNNLNLNDEYPQSFLYLLNSFKGLETIIIKVGIDDYIAREREDFADAIQKHEETLKILIFQFRRDGFCLGLSSYKYLLNAIQKCKKLSQLYLESEPEYCLIGIDELIENLPDLTLLYLASMNMPVCCPPVEDIDLVAKNLLESVPTSSKLSLLCFRTRLCFHNSIDHHENDYVECFFRSRVRRSRTSGFEKEPITTVTTKEALYLVRESGIIRTLEPWSFQQQEPIRWFEE